jgi:hypothetical protein
MLRFVNNSQRLLALALLLRFELLARISLPDRQSHTPAGSFVDA